MTDASRQALEKAELLSELRRRPQLEEKEPGTFYAEARVFVRLVERDDGLYADLRWPRGHEFDRFEVGSDIGLRQLLSALDSRFEKH